LMSSDSWRICWRKSSSSSGRPAVQGLPLCRGQCRACRCVGGSAGPATV
jgi:hypothetical protein